ncbi:MAG: type II secretion system protein [Planctomycetes bacterium]|nr:type II secretion system protein [Planctomycetota bacterium]
MQVNNRKGPRWAFTLIEMLVVIAIIAVLVSLTAGVVLRILGKGPETQRRSDISQLQADFAQFKVTFKLSEQPPSRLALRSNILQYDMTDKLEKESKEFLVRMFGSSVGLTGKYDANGNPIPYTLAWAGYQTDANGNYIFDANGNPIPISFPQPMRLSGDQCLVFFLGGITDGTPPTCQGFSSNSRNPTALGGDRIGPFYKFESNRLAPSNGFYSYNDPYGRPYAYFSSYKTKNGYNRYYNAYQNSDCANLNVWPYYSAKGKYHNPESFQIISAGKDTTFGCTKSGLDPNDPNPTPWNPGNTSGAFEDDMSNFYDAVLGSK